MSAVTLPAPSSLSDDQTRVFDLAMKFISNPMGSTFQVDGPAGAGKTRLLSEIAQTIDFAHLVAPHGKAASILRRKTGLKAGTMHSAFYRLREIKRDEKGRRD